MDSGSLLPLSGLACEASGRYFLPAAAPGEAAQAFADWLADACDDIARQAQEAVSGRA